MKLEDSFKLIQSILNDMANATDGISTGEIVTNYGISRRLVPKYIGILEAMGIPIYQDRKRYYLDENYGVTFQLTPEESELLVLALERFLSSHARHWASMSSLIRKISGKMPNTVADHLSRRLNIDPASLAIDQWFRVLVRAKHQRREVLIAYHPLNRAETTRWKLRPFRFVANPLSDGLYVLGDGTQDGKNYLPLSLKFDRILQAELTNEHYEIVEQARFMSRHGKNWGVWHSDRPPVRVTLQFEPRHYDRLLESIWHPTQHIVMQPDGYVIFSVKVSAPQEMVSWIRSWGSGVVVVEPEPLRQRIIRSMQRQMQAYGISTSYQQDTVSATHYLWAKYDRHTRNFHLLLYHLLDVAAVAHQMWAHVLSKSQRDWLMVLLNRDDNSMGNLLAFFVGIHDIGKATPGFQKKAPSLYERILEAGITDQYAFDEPHGILSTVILKEYFTKSGMDAQFARRIASVIGGHHGAWITTDELNKAKGATGDTQWNNMQIDLLNQLRDTLSIEEMQLPDDDTTLNIFAVFLSGFVSVCDWIGSQEDYFPYETGVVPPEDYFQRSLQQAEKALAELGWFGWQAQDKFRSFDAIFPFAPNALQRTAITHSQFVDKPPRLILVEYLTGGGKTELALYLADMLVNTFRLAGVYVAIPTQATSNQMFGRVADYLEARYPQQTINLQLIHGESEHHPLYKQIQPAPNRVGDESGLVAEKWFQNRKRALLSPYAVGTVDQAMLGVLQTKHHFVRTYGLSNKVIIFDEIHGYDTYMNAIIDRLFEWLTALQSPMILLSATLAHSTRQHLLEQVGASTRNLPDIPYPRLTIVTHDGQVAVHPLPQPPTRIINIEHLLLEAEAFLDWLAQIYRQGGCIAIICNTVDEAIATTHLLRNSAAIESDDVWLFHARYPSAWRGSIEAQFLSAFGKNGERPERTILVATQIIEQSLDLDFDLIVTSTAPIDMLIQRAGRLHRHPRASRPSHLAQPTLVIRTPAINADDVPDFGVDGVVYQPYILLKTWLVLRQITQLHIPEDVDAIMNFVYGDNTPEDIGDAYVQALQHAYDEMTLDDTRSTFKGTQHRIGAPHDERLIGRHSEKLSDDDRLNIATRNIPKSVDIICLSRDVSQTYLPSLGDSAPTRDQVATLLRYRIKVTRSEIRQALEKLPLNPHWERIPQLRYAHPIEFDENGIFDIPDSLHQLRLTPEYGLEMIQKESV